MALAHVCVGFLSPTPQFAHGMYGGTDPQTGHRANMNPSVVYRHRPHCHRPTRLTGLPQPRHASASNCNSVTAPESRRVPRKRCRTISNGTRASCHASQTLIRIAVHRRSISPIVASVSRVVLRADTAGSVRRVPTQSGSVAAAVGEDAPVARQPAHAVYFLATPPRPPRRGALG